MKILISQTEIKCDCCSRTIVNPITGFVPEYLQFEDIDLCAECSVKVLNNLLSNKDLTKEHLAEIIDDIQHHYGRYQPNIALL